MRRDRVRTNVQSWEYRAGSEWRVGMEIVCVHSPRWLFYFYLVVAVMLKRN